MSMFAESQCVIFRREYLLFTRSRCFHEMPVFGAIRLPKLGTSKTPNRVKSEIAWKNMHSRLNTENNKEGIRMR